MAYLAVHWPEQFCAGRADPWPPYNLVEDAHPPGWSVMELDRDRTLRVAANPDPDRWY